LWYHCWQFILILVVLQNQEIRRPSHPIGIPSLSGPRSTILQFQRTEKVKALNYLPKYEQCSRLPMLTRILPAKYPVVTSFADWRFPTCLPLPRRDLQFLPCTDERPLAVLQAQLLSRDRSCRLTLHEDGCEAAHLVPKSEAVWFIRNGMSIYVNPGNVQAIDHHGNAIFVLAHLHHLMDQRAWVPMLKENKLVACTICKPPGQPLSNQFCSLYTTLGYKI
jgi:hypothetical protein